LGKYVSRAKFDSFLSEQIGQVQGTILHLGCGPKSYQAWTPAREVLVDIHLYPLLNACVDAHQLPFTNNSFDGVLIEEMLEHCQTPYQVIDEVRRVLKPDMR